MVAINHAPNQGNSKKSMAGRIGELEAQNLVMAQHLGIMGPYMEEMMAALHTVHEEATRERAAETLCITLGMGATNRVKGIMDRLVILSKKFAEDFEKTHAESFQGDKLVGIQLNSGRKG